MILILIVPGEVTSVYVRNLPANVTEAEIDHEFKHFGRIKPDGIFIRVRKVTPSSALNGILIYPSIQRKSKKANVEIDVHRKLEFAMHLWNLKTLLVFKMHLRFVFILFNILFKPIIYLIILLLSTL